MSDFVLLIADSNQIFAFIMLLRVFFKSKSAFTLYTEWKQEDKILTVQLYHKAKIGHSELFTAFAFYVG